MTKHRTKASPSPVADGGFLDGDLECWIVRVERVVAEALDVKADGRFRVFQGFLVGFAMASAASYIPSILGYYLVF